MIYFHTKERITSMICTNCQHTIPPKSQYCNYCGMHLETQKLPIVPKDNEVYLQALERLENRIEKQEQNYYLQAYEGQRLLWVGLGLCGIFIFHIGLQMFPYSKLIGIIENLVILFETAIPLLISFLIRNIKYRQILMVLGLSILSLAVYRWVITFF